MRKPPFRHTIIAIFSTLFFFTAYGQQPNNIAKWISSQSRSTIESPQLYKKASIKRSVPKLKDSHFLEIDNNVLASLAIDRPAMLKIDLPLTGGHSKKLLLARVEVTTPDFVVSTKGKVSTDIQYDGGIHYRGIIEGDNQSIAAMSFINGEVTGFYSSAQGDYTIGKVKNENDLYVVYNDKIEPHAEVGCYTESLRTPFQPHTEVDNRGIGCKVVKVYFECDYQFYQDKGSSVSNVTNYVTAFFNQVATLYQNENIDIQISQVTVWNSVDPYASLTSTSAVLNSFLTNTGPNFNGDLAHFLSTRNLGGGIAYVDVLCVKSYAFGVSQIYNTYNDAPTYSWTVEVVTHELGHNLGSPHTHSCSWPGGPIDNCYTPEGSCSAGPAPTNGGTIMSYCHLTSTGINFNNGFGTLPGNKIRDRVSNSSCLSQNGVVPTGLATNNINSSSASLSWIAVPNATEYTILYRMVNSSNWNTAGTSVTNSFTLNTLASNTNYEWKVKTTCSEPSAILSFITNTSSGCNIPSGLGSSSITSSSATISWIAVAGANNYIVQYKLSTSTSWLSLSTVTSTSTSLTGLSALSTYNWQVKANCSDYSAAQSFTTIQASGCAAPSNLVNASITNSSASLSWTAVSGATNYTVQYKVSTSSAWTTLATVNNNSTNLTGLLPSTVYNWKVKAGCSDYSSITTFTTLQASGCAIPVNLNTAAITNNSANISWSLVSGATNYTIQYKLSSSSVWITLITLSQTSITVNGLTAATTYNWKVKANCSDYSASNTFTTLGSGNCNAPVGLNTSAITYNSALLSWTAVSGATNYTLQYKLSSSSTWITLTTISATSISFTGLAATTVYNWKVKANCSDYASAATFTTLNLNCDVPVGLSTSGVTTNSALALWTTVQGATQYTVQYRIGSTGTWVTAGTNSVTSISMINLLNNTTYQWHVKANCSDYSATVSFTTLSGTCSMPIGLATSSITNSTGVFSWTSVGGASNYTVQFKLAASNTWSTLATISGTTISITGLTASTTYNWKVKASCSEYASALSFTTAAGTSDCVPPTGLNNTNITSTSVKCNWNTVQSATSYVLLYKVSSSSTWTQVNNIQTNNININNLQSGTSYTWLVKANCATNFSVTATFTTVVSGGLPTGSEENSAYRLYPNPVRDQFHVTIDNLFETPNGTISIFSTDGSLKHKTTIDSNDMILSTSDLTSGLYLVKVERTGHEPQVLKFVKQD
ncbi:MAG TPA: fibronectin type III domain-containing protein [Saprospiraceae bacterium]|nr:fibronectin type III domain-containing protein [Saprospiraceae bacterium]